MPTSFVPKEKWEKEQEKKALTKQMKDERKRQLAAAKAKQLAKKALEEKAKRKQLSPHDVEAAQEYAQKLANKLYSKMKEAERAKEAAKSLTPKSRRSKPRPSLPNPIESVAAAIANKLRNREKSGTQDTKKENKSSPSGRESGSTEKRSAKESKSSKQQKSSKKTSKHTTREKSKPKSTESKKSTPKPREKTTAKTPSIKKRKEQLSQKVASPKTDSRGKKREVKEKALDKINEDEQSEPKRDKDLEKHKNLDTTVEKIRQLYFEEGRSQQEVAENLGFKTTKPIRRIFEEQGWKARWGISQKGIEKPGYFQERRARGKLNPDEVRRQYYDEGLTQKQIAERAGYSSVNPIRQIFKEKGWEPRVLRGETKPHHFKSEGERKLARIEHKKKSAQRIRDMRENLWGKECRLCSTNKDEKTLHIHKKDGKEHHKEALHRMGFLKAVDSNEYAPLCTACHRGTHWLMSQQRMDWKEIESFSERFNKSHPKHRISLELPDASTKSSEKYKELVELKEKGPKELRRNLFGDNCHFCGTHSKDMKIVTHRKDFRTHDKRLLASEKYLRTLDPSEWAALCQKCHRYTHWANETLGMDWDDFESM